MRESLPMSDGDDRLMPQFNGIMFIEDDDELESENEYEKYVLSFFIYLQ
jgi:hypothetical protein